jgi:hypothetical protein
VIRQVIFQPSNVTGADGWTETGAPLVGPAQPPNRTLPAPIFDLGTSYAPNNGVTGNWVIRKTVISDVAGPGFLSIPDGSFPSLGGIYADDIVAQIRLNGVAVPFTNIGGGTVPAQSVPVTWLAGNNTVEIEVSNTVAGNTSLAGQLIATGPGVPCDCCPTGGPQCALVAAPFTGVAETAAQAGWNQVDLSFTIDGATASAAQSGYNTAVGNTPSTTLRVTYTHSTPQQRVRGLRLWNQCGVDLNDADGLGTFTAEFYSGATLLATLLCGGGNGATPFTFLLPPGVELSNVDSVVLRTMSKQIGGGVAPLWRELQLVEFQTVFPCRRRNGTLEWYDANGNRVPTTDVVSCDTGASPFVTIPDLRLTGFFFGDGPDPAGENICNVVPTPTATTNFAAPVGGCYDPNGTANPTMDWTLPSSVELEYGNPPHTSGGVQVQFSSPTLGAITWPTNGTGMEPGEQRTSNIFGGGRRAVLTYISGPAAGAPSQSIRMLGGATLGIHLGTTDNTTPATRFRLDFIAA